MQYSNCPKILLQDIQETIDPRDVDLKLGNYLDPFIKDPLCPVQEPPCRRSKLLREARIRERG